MFTHPLCLHIHLFQITSNCLTIIFNQLMMTNSCNAVMSQMEFYLSAPSFLLLHFSLPVQSGHCVHMGKKHFGGQRRDCKTSTHS